MSDDPVLSRAPLRLRWKQRLTLGLLFAVSLATTSVRAAGETASARVDTGSPLFAEGLRSLDARQYSRARQSFERLYRNSATPDVLFQLGRVAQAEGKDVLAADLFRRYRELVGGQLDPANRSVIDNHLGALKQPATEVRIVAPDGDFLSVDGQLIGRSPLVGTVLIAPGRHRFSIENNGTRSESDVLTIPEGRPAQVNLSAGSKGAAIAVLSLPPAAMLTFTGATGIDAPVMESIRRVVGSNMAKEQTILVSAEKIRSLLSSEPADCLEQADCLDRVAEKAEARAVVVVRWKKVDQRLPSIQNLVGANVVIRDVATKQLATDARFACDGCSGPQLLDRFGQMVGQMIATANNRPRTMLTVQSTPSGASVFIDGQRIGETPLERMSFAGSHTVKVAKDGYDPVERTLELQLNQSNTIDLQLPKQTRPTFAGARPVWRLALGGILIGGGILTAVLGASALSVNGSCDETMPTTDGVPCPMIYFTNGVGGGLLGGGLALTAAGTVLMALPVRIVDQRASSYPFQTVMKSLAVDF